MQKRRIRKRVRWFLVIHVRIGILVLILYFLVVLIGFNNKEPNIKNNEVKGNTKKEISLEPYMLEEKLKYFAKENKFSVAEYPQELIEMMKKNPETEEYVLNYPLKKNTFSEENLMELEGVRKVPLLMQWDERWGYYQYGDNMMGLTGCGPTCLSMVASYLLQNAELTPIYMANYSMRNGYCVSGNGTSWDFMSRGAESLGLKVREVQLNENKVKQYLEKGCPIICIMGPGEFTDEGHFIVLTGWENGMITINDPNSRERSEKLWEFDEIKAKYVICGHTVENRICS